jgi:hypothetical protein
MFSDGIRLVESVLIDAPLMLGRVMIPAILAIIPPCLPMMTEFSEALWEDEEGKIC